MGDMLPVIVDGKSAVKEGEPFLMQRTARAGEYDFMRLGENAAENEKAWSALGPLPWYQPVAMVHPLAQVLAQHPTDKCADGVTPQPLIAVRRYGKGEVIYFGFNETWRLQRWFGDKYYRQFWGQVMYHLGLSRALGAQKRFQATTDRKVYRAGESVRLTVEAYNRDFEPLGAQALTAKLFTNPIGGDSASQSRELTVPLTRGRNVYETSFPVYATGGQRLLVLDPVSGQQVEMNFTVASVAVERREVVRNTRLQEALAKQTGGAVLELWELDKLEKLLKEVKFQQPAERESFPLWSTWGFMLLAVGIWLAEWILRKRSDLA
jgi:hypothetical protein